MSHLREHKFKHNFQDCLNPICSCGLDIESASHFLLHCPTFNDERYTLLSTLNNIDCTLLELTKSSLSKTLLYGNILFNKDKKHAFLTQQLKIFYLLKDLRSPLFGKFPSEIYILPEVFFFNVLLCFLPIFILSHFFYFFLFPSILEFWCLVTVTFKFTVLYNNIYRKKK